MKILMLASVLGLSLLCVACGKSESEKTSTKTETSTEASSSKSTLDAATIRAALQKNGVLQDEKGVLFQMIGAVDGFQINKSSMEFYVFDTEDKAKACKLPVADQKKGVHKNIFYIVHSGDKALIDKIIMGL